MSGNRETAAGTGADQHGASPEGTPPARTGALLDALAAEHAASYAYGAIGARLEDDLAEDAREVEQAHRQRRDTLVVLLDERGVTAPAPAAAYQLPFPVTDSDAGLQLAVLIEERVAAVWRAALPEVTRDDRVLALAALVDAAVRATRWRMAAGVTPATVPFPGASTS